MNKLVVFLFCTFCISFEIHSFTFNSLDSVGISTKGTEKFIVHEVEAGEKLFALSRRYNIGVQAIKDANETNVSNLSVGQKVLIPYVDMNTPEDGILHTVKSSETLFSISRQYDVRVDDLKKWNSLSENNISIGQTLLIKQNLGEINISQTNENSVKSTGGKTHTVEQSQTLYSISRMYGVSTDQLQEWNNLESSSLNIGQVLIVAAKENSAETETPINSSMLPSNEQNKKDNSEVKAAQVEKEVAVVSAGASEKTVIGDIEEEPYPEKPAEKVVQKGIAEVIEDDGETKKYLALHRDAPMGTIMQVRNEMNDQSVFVRVVGPIQDTGDNSKVILKLSKKAYDRLGAVDKRFPVELSYIP